MTREEAETNLLISDLSAGRCTPEAVQRALAIILQTMWSKIDLERVVDARIALVCEKCKAETSDELTGFWLTLGRFLRRLIFPR